MGFFAKFTAVGGGGYLLRATTHSPCSALISERHAKMNLEYLCDIVGASFGGGAGGGG